jgi:hypothetical protein
MEWNADIYYNSGMKFDVENLPKSPEDVRNIILYLHQSLQKKNNVI